MPRRGSVRHLSGQLRSERKPSQILQARPAGSLSTIISSKVGGLLVEKANLFRPSIRRFNPSGRRYVTVHTATRILLFVLLTVFSIGSGSDSATGAMPM